ncbi:hypothetical protein HYU15_00870 [Candidatus Woesearchaeota archaeon]|nr:hypothetical protein [Candidatus Woesearchaeota archaeon]
MKYKAIMLFLLALSALLAIYILFKGINVYQDSRAESDRNFQPSISCIGYIYSVKALNYNAEAKTLAFTIENKQYSDAEISSITITSDRQARRTFQKRLLNGMEAEITATGFDMERNFTIYPDSCALYSKTCFPETNECIGYEPPSTE